MLSKERWTAAVFIVSIAVLIPRAVEGMDRSNGDVIVEFNQLLQTNITGPPVGQPRSYAMLQIAMADAVVAIEGQYAPFHAQVSAPSGASAEAAAAQAGHDVLVSLFPAAQAAADAALANRLAPLPPGQARLGVQVGKSAAAAILGWRMNDGYVGANPQPPAFVASTLPGIWVPTASGPYQFSLIYTVTPFGLLTPFQFLPTPFPQLESTEYAAAFNEVKDVGRSDSTVRTPEQGRFAQLFAGNGPAFQNVTNVFRLWSNVARDVSRSNSLSLVDTARLFAMMWASMHDSILTSHSSKAVYRLWRPETAIAHADIDDNPATFAEPGWAPLIPTPPYPAYSSDMTCLATGASRMLAHLLGDAQTFTATWYTATGDTVFAQPYTSLWALAVDEGNSRVWGGIHYRFDIEASQVSCTQVADYMFDNYMAPRRGH